MILEVRGARFTNKGADLMIRAVVQHFAESHKGISLASRSRDNYTDRSSQGLYFVVERPAGIWIGKERRNNTFNWIATRMLGRRLRPVFGVVDANDISGILDISGYIYGDIWGEARCHRLHQTLRGRRKGFPVVLMPQAFGPFNKRTVRDAFLKALERVSLVFARDSVSYGFICEILPGDERISLSPDFTTLVKPIPVAGITTPPNCVCIVPNSKMISATPKHIGSQYIQFLSKVISILRSMDIEPIALNHEGPMDDYCIQIAGEQAGKSVRSFTGLNGAEAKWLIGKCNVVISSRYHSIISALSQSIPTIGLGWSHKYNELFKSYDCIDNLIGIDIDEEILKSKLENLIRSAERDSLITRLNNASKQSLNETILMWQKIDRLLGLID